MAESISVQFVNGEERSVVFFSHWHGAAVKDRLAEFIKGLMEDRELYGKKYPTTRLEPDAVVYSWIWFVSDVFTCWSLGARVMNDGYENEEDLGHITVDLKQLIKD